MSEADKSLSLQDVRVLLVEDEYYLATDLVRALTDAGAKVTGPVASVAEAQRLIDADGFNCAVLDVNLRGELAYSVADRLQEAGIPFLLATGYDAASLPERFRATPRIEKPFEPAEAGHLLARIAAKD